MEVVEEKRKIEVTDDKKIKVTLTRVEILEPTEFLQQMYAQETQKKSAEDFIKKVDEIMAEEDVIAARTKAEEFQAEADAKRKKETDEFLEKNKKNV